MGEEKEEMREKGEGRGRGRARRALTTRRKRPPARQPQAPSAFLGWPRRASVSGFCPGQAPARRPGLTLTALLLSVRTQLPLEPASM